MATTEQVHAPRLGETGEGCTTCGAPLAEDQRYCLNCGTRRAEARVPFGELLDRGGAVATAREAEFAPVRPDEGPRPITPLGAGLGLALLVLALGVGVLIGTAGEDDQTAKAPPPVINVGEDAGGPANASATTADTGGGDDAAGGPFKSDWPDGKEGYTVSLQTFEKKGTDVAALNKAKEDAVGKGAKDAGLLDSDQYKSLAAGQFVLFNGVFANREQADAALAKLNGFPDAEVVQVAKAAPKGKDDAKLLSGAEAAEVSPEALNQFEATCKKDVEACQKLRRKLPDEITITGPAPKKQEEFKDSELKKQGGKSI